MPEKVTRSFDDTLAQIRQIAGVENAAVGRYHRYSVKGVPGIRHGLNKRSNCEAWLTACPLPQVGACRPMVLS